MRESFYEIVDDGPTLRVASTAHTNGPWAPGLQHAGPPAALLAREVRRLPEGPPNALPARLTFDIHRPIPVADLLVRARFLRTGKRIALAQATLTTTDDAPLMTLSAWLLRTNSFDDIPQTWSAAPRAEAEEMVRPTGWHHGYLDAIEWRWIEGTFEAPGPAAVWTRLRVDLIEGEPADPLDHLIAVSDSASGISAAASPRDLLFVNTDLTLHLTRMPMGEAIWMRAHSTLDRVGIGRANAELGDAEGVVATSAQCLFVEPQPSGKVK